MSPFSRSPQSSRVEKYFSYNWSCFADRHCDDRMSLRIESDLILKNGRGKDNRNKFCSWCNSRQLNWQETSRQVWIRHEILAKQMDKQIIVWVNKDLTTIFTFLFFFVTSRRIANKREDEKTFRRWLGK